MNFLILGSGAEERSWAGRIGEDAEHRLWAAFLTRVVFGTMAAVQAALARSKVSRWLNTSFLERQDATDRHHNTRKVRRTYTFSKDWRVHESMTFSPCISPTSAGRSGHSPSAMREAVGESGLRRWRRDWRIMSGP